jgi:uncharacterized protein
VDKLHERSYLKTIFWFLLINYVVSIAVNYSYILIANGAEGTLSRLFIHEALLSNVALAYLIVAGLLSIGAFARKKTYLFLGLAVLLVTVMHMLNVLDIIIFRIFKYHINSMVLVLVFTEGARDSLHIGTGTVLTYSAIVCSVIAFEIYIIRFCQNKLSPMSVTRKVVWMSLLMSFVFIIADKATYAVSDLYNVREVMRYTKVFPLYRGITIKKFMARNFGFDTERMDRMSFKKGYSSLAYPLEALVKTAPGDKPNIIYIILDAWRFDMLNEQVAPNIHKFSQEAVVFTNHHSGGNATRFGIFTLIYGVYGTYWHPFLAEHQSPVLLDELMKLGYDFKIISSSKLTNPEFTKTAFVKLPQYINDTLPGTNAEQRDPELAKAFIRWLDERDKKKPFYAFLFFDAPHGPYSYPDQFEKYKPSNKSPNYVTAGKKDAVPLFNSYRNAVYFDDFLTGKVLDAIRQHGLLKDTIILITGDHGEEFFEAGNWGHTSDFSKYQTQVSFILYIPGHPHQEITYLTSHLDVAPTFLKMLGYSTPAEKYSQGQDLFTPTGHASVMVSGWADCAIIDSQNTIVLPTETYNAGSSEVRTTETYQLVPDENAVIKKKQGTIMAVMKNMSVFLK